MGRAGGAQRGDWGVIMTENTAPLHARSDGTGAGRGAKVRARPGDRSRTRGGKRRSGAVFGCGLAVLAVMPLAPGAGWAQSTRGLFHTSSSSGGPIGDFFSLFFGGLRSSSRPASSEPPRIVISPRLREDDGASRWGAGTAYCVRTCDGRYFPLQGRIGEEDDALAQCNAFCPAAKMVVYTSADRARGIDAAVARNGQSYSELPNAFVYRQRLVEGCSCTKGSRIGGLSAVDVMNDPTLKRGDVVVTAQGSRVFAGAKKGPPYRESDFVEPSRFPELPRDMRARLSELKIASR